MADTWFFLSYARLDRDDDRWETVRKFYEDLDEQIRPRKVIKEGKAGFYDGIGIQQGDQWPETLAAALNNCRVLLCLYSPAYFNSEYCGKELAVFNSRLALMPPPPKETKRPQLVIPILLYPPHELGVIPEALSDTQYIDDDYPKDYREEGLKYFFQRPTNPELQNKYQDFLKVLVRKIIDVTAAHNPPSLDNLPQIKTVQSAFVSHSSATNEQATNLEQGPRYADFFYVAGKRNEIEAADRWLETYGTAGELDWRPYLPEEERSVGILAQYTASTEGFLYRQVPLNDDLLKFISEAEGNNRVVILIVDAWTVRLSKYRKWMLEYDKQNFGNSAVLILRNDKEADADTVRQLDTAVQKAFIYKARMSNPHSFVHNIGSPTDFASTLAVTLQKIRAMIIETNNLRRIDSSETIAKPEILGSVATTT